MAITIVFIVVVNQFSEAVDSEFSRPTHCPQLESMWEYYKLLARTFPSELQLLLESCGFTTYSRISPSTTALPSCQKSIFLLFCQMTVVHQ